MTGNKGTTMQTRCDGFQGRGIYRCEECASRDRHYPPGVGTFAKWAEMSRSMPGRWIDVNRAVYALANDRLARSEAEELYPCECEQ
jgi:hypothetical protein